MSFMVWVLLGALAVQMSGDLQLNAAQKGFMVALPVLAGALLRVVFGVLVDRLRPRLAGIIGQVIVIVGVIAAWLVGRSEERRVGTGVRPWRTVSPVRAEERRVGR